MVFFIIMNRNKLNFNYNKYVEMLNKIITFTLITLGLLANRPAGRQPEPLRRRQALLHQQLMRRTTGQQQRAVLRQRRTVRPVRLHRGRLLSGPHQLRPVLLVLGAGAGRSDPVPLSGGQRLRFARRVVHDDDRPHGRQESGAGGQDVLDHDVPAQVRRLRGLSAQSAAVRVLLRGDALGVPVPRRAEPGVRCEARRVRVRLQGGGTLHRSRGLPSVLYVRKEIGQVDGHAEHVSAEFLVVGGALRARGCVGVRAGVGVERLCGVAGVRREGMRREVETTTAVV